MLKPLFASLLVTTPVAFGETLLSGAIYFDSENTFLEVQELIKESNTEGLGALFKHNHISDKLPTEVEIVLLASGSGPESQAEFHFPNSPTTYWTYLKYVKAERVKATPSPSPALNSTLPANLPSSLISPVIHTPLSVPDPSPDPPPAHKAKSRMAAANSSLRRHHHHRVRESSALSVFWRRVKRGLAQIF